MDIHKEREETGRFKYTYISRQTNKERKKNSLTTQEEQKRKENRALNGMTRRKGREGRAGREGRRREGVRGEGETTCPIRPTLTSSTTPTLAAPPLACMLVKRRASRFFMECV